MPVPVTGQKTISFVHVNDLHAHLTTHADIETTNGAASLEMRGGFARLATAIKRIRSENPLSVVMNVGDTFHGGIEALFTEGNAIVAPVNALGIDVGVPGNWDFAYGPAVTRSRYTTDHVLLNPSGQTILQPNFPNLGGNVTNVFPAPRAGQMFLPPTWVKSIGGVTVGFIGMTSDIVPKMHPILAVGLDFLQGQAAYRDLVDRYAADLRTSQGAQIVVVMSELGIHKDLALANVIQKNAVDVFFSAHTHELVSVPLNSTSGALVVEPGSDADIGRMDITIANGVVIDRKWRILDIDTSIPEDPAVKTLVDEARAPFLAANVNLKPVGNPSLINESALTRPINTVVGITHQTLDRRHALENPLNNVIADVMRQVGGTQIAFTPGFRFDTVDPAQGALFEDNTVASGNITLEDVYRFFPVPYNIATGSVKGARFREIMEQNLTEVFSADAFHHAGGWANGYAGLNITLNLTGTDGSKITKLALLGAATDISATDDLMVTGCQRPFEINATTLCSYTGFTNVLPLQNATTGSAWSIPDLFVYGITNGLIPSVARVSIQDTSNALLWPKGSFLQPISIQP